MDLALELDIRERLERATRRVAHVVDLWNAPPLLLAEIVREGISVVVTDESLRASFEAKSIALYLDTRHLREVQHAYLRERTEARR